MEIQEIVQRPDNLPISEEEAMFLITEYIRVKKGVKVNMHIEKRYGIFGMEREYSLMAKMLPYAVSYFRENRF